MGGCISKKGRIFNAPPTSTSSSKSIADMRETLILHIFRLHRLVQICRRGIEECISLQLKDIAIVIKGKELYLRLKLKEIQEMIKTTDEFSSFCQQDKKINELVLTNSNLLLRDLNKTLILDDVDALLKNEEKHKENVKKELKNVKIDEQLVLKETEKEFAKKKNQNDKRKKYIKQTS